jgi:hypothetical protein
VTRATDVLTRLAVLGARVERRGDRLILCAGPRPVPKPLVDAARAAKPELLALLAAPGTPIDAVAAVKSATSAAAGDPNTAADGLNQESQIFCGKAEGSINSATRTVSNGRYGGVNLIGPSGINLCDNSGTEAGLNGGIPRAWAEGIALLDPGRPPGDVPPPRWQNFIYDARQFRAGAPLRSLSAGRRMTYSVAIGTGRSPGSVNVGFSGC